MFFEKIFKFYEQYFKNDNCELTYNDLTKIVQDKLFVTIQTQVFEKQYMSDDGSFQKLSGTKEKHIRKLYNWTPEQSYHSAFAHTSKAEAIVYFIDNYLNDATPEEQINAFISR